MLRHMHRAKCAVGYGGYFYSPQSVAKKSRSAVINTYSIAIETKAIPLGLLSLLVAVLVRGGAGSWSANVHQP